MSYVLNVILFINTVLFKINPPCDKNKPYVKKHFIFIFCIFKIDSF